MKQRFTKLLAAVALLVFMMPSMAGWGQTRTEVTDVMNQTWTGVTGTSYTEVTGLEGSASDAVYTVQCAGSNNSIQLRSKNSNSGIVTTTTGGTATKVVVTWNSNTTNGNKLDVYGKNTAYDNPSDLYGSSSGTLIGSIVYGTSTELTITDSYTFIGMRSNNGAIYLTKIDVTWENGGSSVIPTTVTIDDSSITNTDVYTSTSAGTLTAMVKDNANNVISGATIDWESSNENVATIDANGAVTLIAAGTTTITASFDGDATYGPSSNTYELEVTDGKPATTVTIDATGITNTNVFLGTAAGSLSATVKDDDDVVIEDAIVNWASSNTSVATIAADGVVTLVAAGITTITASYNGDANHKPSSATYGLSVTNVNTNLAVIWSEDFSDFSSGNVPNGGTYNYVCTNGGGTTKIYNEATAGGTAPELLVGKSNGTFSATITLLTSTQCFSGDLTLTYKTNAKSLNVKTTTDGITVEGEASAGAGLTFSSSGVHTITFKGVTTSTENITIVFTATSGENVRLDDIELVGEQEDVSTVATPVFSPDGGIILSGTEVTITCATENASIKFSYDNETWNDYSSALTINENKTIYAKAVKEGLSDSEVASATYTIAEPCAIPTFSPAAGEVEKGSEVTISTTTEGATIYYTTDGSIPTISSSTYSTPITINSAMTIKAIAVKEGMVNSDVATANYTIPDYVTLPFNWGGGTNTELTALTGVTGYGLGVYNSNAPYCVKMDGMGDYIMIKTDSQPAQVTIGVKMIGGPTTSKIKVQESTDGSSFSDVEELTISGSQNDILNLKTSSFFDANTRYVRIIKSVHGSNIGVGPITIAKFTVYSKPIDAYTSDGSGEEPANGWYLIASPVVEDVTPTADNGFLTNSYDIFSFDQNEGLEWQNYKVHHFNIESGHGYLYASSVNTTLVFAGTPYSGNGQVTLHKTTEAEYSGWNLVGNPFSSNATVSKAFYKMNSTSDGINATPLAANSVIASMEGVFVLADQDEEKVTFTATTDPVTNLSNRSMSIDVNRNGEMLDRAIVSFNAEGSLSKLVLSDNTTKLYFRQGQKDYAIVASDNENEMPVSFKASRNGTYTLNINTENVEMNYLHLIDNMTGMDVDLLQTPSYTFDATTNDYASRFRLVFSANNVDGPSTGSGTFAFYSNGNWVVGNEGEATLQVIDVNGRIVSNETINGTVATSINATPGVYMLRLVNGNEVKTQKIVVR